MSSVMRKNLPLKKLTTFQIGGVAEYFTKVSTVKELADAVRWAKENGHTITVIAGGSNVLVPDEGLQGLVIQNGILGVESEENGDYVLLKAGAGVVFDELVLHAVKKEWWGLENLSAIPGSVGATPVQNVGAYGVEVSDLITHVAVFDIADETEKTLTNDMCAFLYRNSLFKREEGRHYIITGVTYRLSKKPSPTLTYRDVSEWFSTKKQPTIREMREAVIAIRQKKFPDWRKVGTVGSFFKNPIVSEDQFNVLKQKYPAVPGFSIEGGVKLHLGWILDKILHLRGYREGSLGTYAHQALVLINYGGATAHDVHAFAKMIEEKVFSATGVHIEWEATLLGDRE